MEFLSKDLAELDTKTREVASQDLKLNQIMKNTKEFEKMSRSIQENMKLFSEEASKGLLFNIGTGKWSKQEISDFCWMLTKLVKKPRKTSLFNAWRT